VFREPVILPSGLSYEESALHEHLAKVRGRALPTLRSPGRPRLPGGARAPAARRPGRRPCYAPRAADCCAHPQHWRLAAAGRARPRGRHPSTLMRACAECVTLGRRAAQPAARLCTELCTERYCRGAPCDPALMRRAGGPLGPDHQGALPAGAGGAQRGPARGGRAVPGGAPLGVRRHLLARRVPRPARRFVARARPLRAADAPRADLSCGRGWCGMAAAAAAWRETQTWHAARARCVLTGL